MARSVQFERFYKNTKFVQCCALRCLILFIWYDTKHLCWEWPLFLGSFRCWVKYPFVQGLYLIAKEMEQRSSYYIKAWLNLSSSSTGPSIHGYLKLSTILKFLTSCFRKDTEPFYHYFYVLTCITLLSSIYPLLAMHSLLVTLDVVNI